MMTIQNFNLRSPTGDSLGSRSAGEFRSIDADPAGFASLLRNSQVGTTRAATAPLQNVAALTAAAPAPNPTPVAAPIPSAQIATAAPHAQPLAPPPQAVKSSATPRTPTTATASATPRTPTTATTTDSDSHAAGASAAPTAARLTAAGKTGAAARRGATQANGSSVGSESDVSDGSDGSKSVVTPDAHPHAAHAKHQASAAPTGEPTPPWLADLQRGLMPAPPTGVNGVALNAAGVAAGVLGIEARSQQAPVPGDASNAVSNASGPTGPDFSRDSALPGAWDGTKDNGKDRAGLTALDSPLGGAAGNANAAAVVVGPGFAAVPGDSHGVDPAALASPASNPPGRALSGAGDATALSALVASAAAAAANALQSRNLQSAVAPTVVRLAATVTEPEFAQALGVQISVLASAGVQRAELHLNPADLGPVSVQIILDGTKARVDFGADVAATRAAIESGLPALAAALSDAGFTLSGGGVSQHSRGRSDAQSGGSQFQSNSQSNSQSQSDAQRRGTGDEPNSAMRAGARRTVTLGGLDLYA